MSNDDEDFAALLAEYDQGGKGKQKRPRVGDTVRGRIVSIGKDAEIGRAHV